MLPKDLTGTWSVIATTYQSGATGAFEIYTKGLPSLAPASNSALERQILVSAFASRGVEDQEAARRARIATAAEVLSLASSRSEVIEQLRSEIDQRETERASATARMREHEAREAAFKDALQAVDALSNSRDLVRSILQEKLEAQRREVEISAAAALEDLTRIEANSAALLDLAELESLADRISDLENALLQSRTPDEIERVRPQLLRARQEFDIQANTIAERLLSS